MDQLIEQEIREHASREYPKEACGLIVTFKGRAKYIPCTNIAANPLTDFSIHAEEYAAAEDSGEVAAIVHSHPDALPLPSQQDLVACELSGLPWVIVAWPLGTIHEFSPTGYEAPLIGRKYDHGIFDCFSLVRDYYRTECGIIYADYPREDEWWHKGQNLYMDNLAEAGFLIVTDGTVKVHDTFLMQVESPVVNHAAVYIGRDQIMHHCVNRLSSRDVYGGYWRKITIHTIRHRSLDHA